MGPNLSPATSPVRLPRILIAERHFSCIEPLIIISAIGDRRLDADFDVCTSHCSAGRKLLASPYQLIIKALLAARVQALEKYRQYIIQARTRALDRLNRLRK
jgi:hypothetical protein